MKLLKLWEKLSNEISREIIEKYRNYIKKMVILNWLLVWKNRDNSNIYTEKIKLNKNQEMLIFWVDLDNDDNIDKVYDISWNLIFFDLNNKQYELLKKVNITPEGFVKIELLSSLIRLTYMNNLTDKEWVKKYMFEIISDPELSNWFFSDKYITLLDFVKILKTFDKLWLNLKEKLDENIKKVCKLEKEKFWTQEVCNKYKNLYEKVWKEKMKEFPEIIMKWTKTVSVLWWSLYTYYYQENELKELKWFVPEGKYKEYIEILKQRDIKFVKNVINLIKKWYIIFEYKINFSNFLENKLDYKYLWNDAIKVTDGKKQIIINPFKKYIKIWSKEIGFWVDDAIEQLLYSLDNIDNEIEEKEEKALEYARKYISLINKWYIIFADKKWWHNYKILNIKELFWDFWKRKLDIKYLKNDIVQITDGKEKILMNTNPGKKYIIYKEKKIYFGLNPDKIDVLEFKIDNYKP